jgi:hypothetical protein
MQFYAKCDHHCVNLLFSPNVRFLAGTLSYSTGPGERSALKRKNNTATHGKIYADCKGGFGQDVQNNR